MTDPFSPMQKYVLKELKKQRRREQLDTPAQRAKILGVFIQSSLSDLKKSRRWFAQKLDIDEELADGLLKGMLPLSEIDDDWLVEIAHLIEHDPNALRILIGREPVPMRSADSKSLNGTARA